MLRLGFAVLLSAHALLHVLGFAKAFGLAPLEQLRKPIPRPLGLAWLGAALLLSMAAAAWLVAPRWFWALAVCGLIASQVVIITSWGDARFGTVANALLLAAAAYGAFAWGPFGLRAEYERRVTESASRHQAPRARLVTEDELAKLPRAVQRYLRFVGVVGERLPGAFRARMTGRIRGSSSASWMPFEAEQVNLYDPPRRFFFMRATRGGVPLDGLHIYDEQGASMRIRLLSSFPMVGLSGPELTRTETVTLLNDMSIFAPARLLDPAISWREVGERSVEATYTNGPHTVRAQLLFDDSSALIDFWSDDRPALAEDGKTLLPRRWSTPLRGYRSLDGQRLATRGEARYAGADENYAYLELSIESVSTALIGAGNDLQRDRP
jgi:hypothetical protein